MSGAPAGGLRDAAGAALTRLVPEGRIGVAVSGGGDSMALLALVAGWGQGREIAVATVDHGLRPESAGEARAVAEICARLGLPHDTLTADLAAAPGNLSAAARAERYRLLADWARGRGCAAVLLGHTMDDVAETLLMRLARGSGIEGLAAMAEARRQGGMLWLRPLLALRRADLRAYLAAEGIPWCEDPTNDDPAYDRVKARQALAALAPLGIGVEGLAASAGHLMRQRRVLERAMADLAATARRWGAFGEAWIAIAPLHADEPDTALRLLADTLCRVSGADYRPRFAPLAGLLDAALAGSAALTLSGCLVRSRGDRLLICREPAACAPPRPLGEAPLTWDRRWHVLASDLPDGATIGALGEAGLRALAEAEDWSPPPAWTDAPREVRLTVPAVRAADGALLAVPAAHFPPETGQKGRFRVEIAPIQELS